MITDQKTIDALKVLNYSQVYEKGKEDMKKEILEKIDNYNEHKLRWLWNDGEVFIALSSLKKQINSEKEENKK